MKRPETPLRRGEPVHSPLRRIRPATGIRPVRLPRPDRRISATHLQYRRRTRSYDRKDTCSRLHAIVVPSGCWRPARIASRTRTIIPALRGLSPQRAMPPIGHPRCQILSRRRHPEHGFDVMRSAPRPVASGSPSLDGRRGGPVVSMARTWLRQPAAVCGQERRQDAAGRRTVASEGRQQIRHCHHRQPHGARNSGRREDGANRLTEPCRRPVRSGTASWRC